MDDRADAEVLDDLLPALRRREPAAFHALYDRMAGPLQAYAHARLGDRHAAEDVVQESFERLARHARRFRGDGLGLLAWLYTTTRRGCVDVHRRRGRRREATVAHPPEPTRRGNGASDDPGPADPARAIEDALDPALEAALAALTDDQREALLLRRVAGLAGDEVAQVMGRDREAVYALCARAEARLRDLLGAHAPRGARMSPTAPSDPAGHVRPSQQEGSR